VGIRRLFAAGRNQIPPDELIKIKSMAGVPARARVFVNKSDEFRRNAEECLRMAERTAEEGDKRAWLRLAESWLRMIRPEAAARRQTASEQFEARERAEGTRQQQSTGSH
jgi:hypothetical protein